MPALALPSVKDVARQHAASVTRVFAAGTQHEGHGFVIGSGGQMLASLDGARPGDAVVVELASGERHRAQVTAVDRMTRLSVLEPFVGKDPAPTEPAQPFSAVELAEAKTGAKPPHWLTGVWLRPDGSAVASLGGIRKRGKSYWVVDLPSPAGSPVLDDQGRVIAVTIVQESSGRARAVPIARVRAFLAEAFDRPRSAP